MRNPAAHVIQMLKSYKGVCANSRATAAGDASATLIDLKAGEGLIVEVHGDFNHPTLIEESTGKTFQFPDDSYFEYITP